MSSNSLALANTSVKNGGMSGSSLVSFLNVHSPIAFISKDDALFRANTTYASFKAQFNNQVHSALENEMQTHHQKLQQRYHNRTKHIKPNKKGIFSLFAPKEVSDYATSQIMADKHQTVIRGAEKIKQYIDLFFEKLEAYMDEIQLPDGSQIRALFAGKHEYPVMLWNKLVKAIEKVIAHLLHISHQIQRAASVQSAQKSQAQHVVHSHQTSQARQHLPNDANVRHAGKVLAKAEQFDYATAQKMVDMAASLDFDAIMPPKNSSSVAH